MPWSYTTAGSMLCSWFCVGVQITTVPLSLSRVESADLCVLIGDLSVVADRLLLGDTSSPLSLSQLARHLLHSYHDHTRFLTQFFITRIFNCLKFSPHPSSSTEASSEDSGSSEWLEKAIANLSPQNTLVVMNKTDLLEDNQRPQLEGRLSPATDTVSRERERDRERKVKLSPHKGLHQLCFL